MEKDTVWSHDLHMTQHGVSEAAECRVSLVTGLFEGACVLLSVGEQTPVDHAHACSSRTRTR